MTSETTDKEFRRVDFRATGDSSTSIALLAVSPTIVFDRRVARAGVALGNSQILSCPCATASSSTVLRRLAGLVFVLMGVLDF